MVGPCAKNMVTMEMHEAQSAARSARPQNCRAVCTMPRAIATASDALSIERSARSAARFERPAKQTLALATEPRETRSVHTCQ